MTLLELQKKYIALKQRYHSNSIRQEDVEYYILALELLIQEYLKEPNVKVKQDD